MTTLRIAGTWDGESAAAGEDCTVRLTPTQSGWLIEVEAAFHGDPPPPGPIGSHDGLWLFEVVELFVAAACSCDEDVAYTEVELSPHGHHLILRFAGVRRRLGILEPRSTDCRIEDGRWRGRVELPPAALPPPPWRANAFAVHGAGVSRRYLAATPLPGEEPDFHQPGTFPLVA